MRALDLDLAPRRVVSQRAKALALLLSVSVLVYTGTVYSRLESERSDLDAKRSSAQRIQIADSVNDTASLERAAARADEMRYANQVVRRLTFPWDQLFNEMEVSVDEQVVLLGVEPDADKRHVKITAEARTLSAMLDYARRLRASAVLHRAFLQSHQMRPQDAGTPVRFVLVAEWDGGNETESRPVSRITQ